MASPIFYKWSTLRRFFKYFSWLIRLFEKPRVKKFAGKKSEYAPVFILGLPRSGSTFLYQALTSMFDVLYFDNLVNLGRGNLFFSVRLSNLIYKNKGHHSFSSKYGNTEASGLHAPSEAGSLWYRWFPREVPDVSADSLSESAKKDLKAQVSSLIGRHQKPLLIKNLYMVTRMKVLKEVFPNAKYIYIERDPLFIAQSIYLGRKKNLENPAAEWWSVPIPNYKSLLNLPLEQQVAQQVFQLQRTINEELAEVVSSNVLRVQYEKLEPEEMKEQFGAFLGAELRQDFAFSKDQYKPGNVQKVDDKVLSQLQSELNRIFET